MNGAIQSLRALHPCGGTHKRMLSMLHTAYCIRKLDAQVRLAWIEERHWSGQVDDIVAVTAGRTLLTHICIRSRHILLPHVHINLIELSAGVRLCFWLWCSGRWYLQKKQGSAITRCFGVRPGDRRMHTLRDTHSQCSHTKYA